MFIIKSMKDKVMKPKKGEALRRYNQVKELLLEGKSPKEIALELNITPSYIYLYPELREIHYENKFRNDVLPYVLKLKGLTYNQIREFINITEVTMRRRIRKIAKLVRERIIKIEPDPVLKQYGINPEDLPKPKVKRKVKL